MKSWLAWYKTQSGEPEVSAISVKVAVHGEQHTKDVNKIKLFDMYFLDMRAS